jgi:Zn-dependent protease with chaperone function
MLEFLQYIAALVIVAQAEDPAAEAAKRPDWVGIALAVAAFALAARIVGALLARAVEGNRRPSVPALMLATSVGRIAALVVFYEIAMRFGGAAAPKSMGIEDWFFVPKVVQLAPFFALVACLAWGLHAAADAMEVGARTSAGAVAAEFRGAVLPLAPIVAYVVIVDVLRVAATSPTSTANHVLTLLSNLPATNSFCLLALLFGMFLLMPFVLRFALRTKPLPDGPLRTRLEAYSRRVEFRARDILVWPTGGDTPNAVVVGALPRFRYVFITDGLLKTLDEDEIEAVFAHEAGHARRGHVPLFFGFTAVLTLVQFVPGADALLGGALSWMPPLARTLVVMLVWMGVVFGWVSRRFEQEADVFGIETLPLPADAPPGTDHPFPRALERIGAEVGEIREVTGWRHFSTSDRVAFARQFVADADVRRRTRGSIRLLRGTLLTVIVGFALAAAARVPGEVRRAPRIWESITNPESEILGNLALALLSPPPALRAGFLTSAAECAERADHVDVAARWLRESVALDPRRPDALRSYAALLEKTGRPLGAKIAWEELAAMESAPPAWRDEARRKAGAEPR